MADYEFGKEELEEIVVAAILRNDKALAKAAILPEDIFLDEYLRWIFSKAKKFYMDHKKLIKKNILLSELNDDVEEKKKKLYIQVINDLYSATEDDMEDIDYAISSVRTLVNRRGVLQAMDKVMDKLKSNDVDGAISVFKEPITDIVLDTPDFKIMSYDDESWHERSKRRLSDENRFANKLLLNLSDSEYNFDTLAKYTYVIGRNCLWLAPAKGGKTTMAIHCAKQAALQGMNVLIVDRENGGNLIEDRIDASLFNIPIDSVEDGSFLKNMTGAKITEKRKKLEKLNGKIRVIYMPSSTVWDLYSLLDQFRLDGNWIPNVIIDEYPAQMRGKSNNNKTQFIEDRYKEFDTLVRGSKINAGISYLGISFIHTKADSSDEEYTQEDISWAKNIGRDVDGLNGLLRNSDERNEDLARIQFLFGRHWGKSQGRQILVNFVGETCTIRSTRTTKYV